MTIFRKCERIKCLSFNPGHTQDIVIFPCTTNRFRKSETTKVSSLHWRHIRECISNISYIRIMFVFLPFLPLALLSMSCLASSERNTICLPNQWQGIEMVTLDIGGYSTKVSNIITGMTYGGNVWYTRPFLVSTLHSFVALAYRDSYHYLVDSVLLYNYSNPLLDNVME